jgi:hypothetical protein
MGEGISDSAYGRVGATNYEVILYEFEFEFKLDFLLPISSLPSMQRARFVIRHEY